MSWKSFKLELSPYNNAGILVTLVTLVHMLLGSGLQTGIALRGREFVLILFFAGVVIPLTER